MKLCEWCREPFVPRSRAGRGSEPSFCSRQCWKRSRAASKPTGTCATCGTVFHPTPGQLRIGRGRFCSIQCASKMEHVLIAERTLGRPLQTGAQVHHVNGDGRDNRNANLVICQDLAYHKLLHVRTRVLKAGGDPNTQKVCGKCRRPKDFAEFYGRATARKFPSDRLSAYCKPCARTEANERQKAKRTGGAA